MSMMADFCSLAYTTVDEVAVQAAGLGRGALLARVDIEADRLIPVHPQDRVLQGMKYIDPMLPFGLRSAPNIFNTVADALHWHLVQVGIAVDQPHKPLYGPASPEVF